MLSDIMPSVAIFYCHAECHYAECRYAECHQAECHYAECRGARGYIPGESFLSGLIFSGKAQNQSQWGWGSSQVFSQKK